MIRTSTTHPLQIAFVETRPNMGRIGVTFCPGKKQPHALTGGWDRDLLLDLDVIELSGAAAVVTLLESHEIAALGVDALGAQVRARYLDWYHLPITDVSVPSIHFERGWRDVGLGLHARLRDGFDVVVHCKGGLGRAGTVAARLLIELGQTPADAIALVRAQRPGAIETYSQEAYLHALEPLSESKPDRSAASCRDRAVGALVGLAVGDAIGTTLEFKTRDSYPTLQDLIGGGPFQLQAGEWTDDTAMALALADSLYTQDEFNPEDLMTRFRDWRDHGTYSCTGTCFDIGVTVSTALRRWKNTGDPYAGSPDPRTAGNGSLMRLAPVAIRHWSDPDKLEQVAALQSRTTHGAPEAVSACATFAHCLADAIAGLPRNEVLRKRSERLAGVISPIMRGSWRGKRREEIHSSGYVAHSLEAALWCVGRTADFRSAVLLAANLGGDADTTAAITGQLAGAIYGMAGIPREWLGKLAWKPRIECMASSLFDHGLPLQS